MRELRKQMSQARSLKDTSQPEFEEKLNRLKQLRDLRSGYLDKINAIKNNIKGLDFKTEVGLKHVILSSSCMRPCARCMLMYEKNMVTDHRQRIVLFVIHVSNGTVCYIRVSWMPGLWS